jgi:uncharacterized protein YbdZ (MbtH family)
LKSERQHGRNKGNTENVGKRNGKGEKNSKDRDKYNMWIRKANILQGWALSQFKQATSSDCSYFVRKK